MKLTDEIDKASLKEDIPEFSPGDTVKVHVRVVEGIGNEHRYLKVP